MSAHNLKPGSLYLHVRAEGVVEKCFCHEPRFSDTFNPKCTHCHGSGKRTVTLAGMVEARVWADDTVEDAVRMAAPIQWLPGRTLKFVTGIHPRSDRASLELHKIIVQALRDNTCPDDIKEQLEVVTDG